MNTPNRVFVLFMLLLSCTVSATLAQETNSTTVLDVTVFAYDDGGAQVPVEGATVVLFRGPRRSGQTPLLSAMTNEQGRARFPAAPVGDIRIEAVAPGYSAVSLEVGLEANRTNTHGILLTGDRQEIVEVTDREDVVSLDEGAVGSTEVSGDFFQDLPVLGREYQKVLTLAPGVSDTDDDGNPNVHGARERDFKLVIDGVSNVDPLTGEFQSYLNPDAIEEIKVIDAGADARYGGAVGGYGEIVTKTGTNQFEGSAKLFLRDSVLDGDRAGGILPQDFYRLQPSLFFAGPIVRDKLWFATAFEYLRDQQPIALVGGDAVVVQQTSTRPFAKVTWQATPTQRFDLQYRADPLEITPADVDSITPPDSGTIYEQGGPALSLQWTLPLTSSLFFESTLAFSNNEREFQPFNRNAINGCVRSGGPIEDDYLAGLLCTDEGISSEFNDATSSGKKTGAFFQDYNDDRRRVTLRTDGEYFVNEFLGGSHRIRFGAASEWTDFDRFEIRRDQLFQDRIVSGDIQIGSTLPTHNITQLVYTPKISPDVAANSPFAPQCDARAPQNCPAEIRDDASGTNLSLYVSDTYEPYENLSITVGARVSHESVSAQGFTTFDPKGERLAWDSYLDECMAQAPSRRPAICMGLLGASLFTVHALDLPLINPDTGRPIGCSAQANTFQCNALETLLTNGFAEPQVRVPENFTIRNTNVAPRFSIAWDPWNDGKTRVAGSWGRYYGDTIYQPFVLENGPDFTTLSRGRDRNLNLLRGTNSLFSGFTISMLDRDLESQFSDEWTVGFEREIARETSIGVRYINRKFKKQLQDVDINHEPLLFDDVPFRLPDGRFKFQIGGCENIDGFADCFGRTTSANGFLENRPDGVPDIQVVNPFYSSILAIGNFNESEYEGFVFELTRRFLENWEMRASYTHAETIGQAEDFVSQLGNDVVTSGSEIGPLDYDQTHSVKLSGRVVLPTLGGLRLGGIASFQSGLPYSLVESRAILDYPSNLAVGASGRNYNPSFSTYGVWFPTPRRYYPSGGRNDRRNPSYWNFDVNVQKDFNMGETRATLQFDVFNLLNDDTIDIEEDRQLTTFNEAGFLQTFSLNPVASRRSGRQFQAAVKVNF